MKSLLSPTLLQWPFIGFGLSQLKLFTLFDSPEPCYMSNRARTRSKKREIEGHMRKLWENSLKIHFSWEAA